MHWPGRDRLVTILAVGLVVLVIGFWALSPTGPLGGLLHPLEYETGTVTLADENGTELGAVEVRIADTEREHYVGLSETDSLAEGEGMLFVFPESARHNFVMRDMSFPLDIVFVASNGTVTTIHHAPTPSNAAEDDQRYPGSGQYVLEVPRGYANATGLDVGDTVVIPSNVTS